MGEKSLSCNILLITKERGGGGSTDLDTSCCFHSYNERHSDEQTRCFISWRLLNADSRRLPLTLKIDTQTTARWNRRMDREGTSVKEDCGYL